MLTGWLWIHSPDRHRGVDVVCSNRSLVLESTSSVVNERLLIPQVHQHKKEKSHWRPQRTAWERFRRSTMHPLACSSIDRRRRRFLLIHSSLSGIIQSTTELFWNLRLLCVRVEPVHRAWKLKKKSTGVKKKPSSDLGSNRPWRRVAKKSIGRSKWLCMMRMRHDAMSGCAG